MKFILTAGWDDGIADLTERIVRELANGKKVLWLTSGGSNIPATVHIMHNIPQSLCSNLTIILADERYGPVGHKDSNWTQLIKAGFRPGKSIVIPVLQSNQSLTETVKHYNHFIDKAIEDCDIVIAQLGIGPDGHIAGLMLGSSALGEESSIATFVSEEEPPLTRLTMTFSSIQKIDAAYCFAFGEHKHKTLKELYKKSIPPMAQPAQILKHLPEAYVYNDQVGHHE